MSSLPDPFDAISQKLAALLRQGSNVVRDSDTHGEPVIYPAPEETHSLVIAFLAIKDPEQRAKVIALAQSLKS